MALGVVSAAAGKRKPRHQVWRAVSKAVAAPCKHGMKVIGTPCKKCCYMLRRTSAADCNPDPPAVSSHCAAVPRRPEDERARGGVQEQRAEVIAGWMKGTDARRGAPVAMSMLALAKSRSSSTCCR